MQPHTITLTPQDQLRAGLKRLLSYAACDDATAVYPDAVSVALAMSEVRIENPDLELSADILFKDAPSDVFHSVLALVAIGVITILRNKHNELS